MVTENIFLKQLNRPAAKIDAEPAPLSSEKASSNMFLKQLVGKKIQEPQESASKEVARTLAQVPLGVAKSHPLSYGADLFKIAAEGASKNVLAELHENDPDFDPEIAEQARQKSMAYVPTQQLAEELIEKHTGAPLTPKTGLQKGVRLASSAASFRKGGPLAKGTAAVVAPSVKKGLETIGVPEGPAETAGLLASGVAPAPGFEKIVKPSGMAARRFENVSKPTKVTPGRASAIKESVEKDFKQIGEKILGKNKTYSALKEDSLFKEKIGELFEDVEHLASNVEGKIHTEDLKGAFKSRYNSRESKGITPDEYERSFKKEVKKLVHEIPYDEFTATQGVEQFRKNNKSLRELYEPGKSSAANRAKKEAILEYNRSLEDVFKKKYPDSEFNKLFEFTNKRWQEISDVEQIESFIGEVFDGKINYGKAKQIFRKDKETVSRPFKRLLGEKGFEDFKSLTEDLLSTEKGMSYIKKAEDAGFSDLAKVAAHYTISPTTAKAHTVAKYGKVAYQMLLDKPQIAVTWKNALDHLKKGNYKEAQVGFVALDKAVKSSDQSKESK